MNTVTRAQLAEVIYAQVGLSRNESADLLEHVLARVAATLEAGESVKISGFGTFSVRQKGRRIGRNPKTGKEVPIPQHVLRFWETKFPQVKPLKRGGGRRYYRPDDIALLRRISDLLYIQGYTIKGVQRLLREGGGTLSDDIPPPAPEEQADAEAADAADPQLPMPGLTTSTLPPAKLVGKSVPRAPAPSEASSPETAAAAASDDGE